MLLRNETVSPEALALDLYAALVDGRDLGPTLDAIAVALGASTHVTHVVQFAGARAVRNAQVSSMNWCPDALAEYATHWVRRDPWIAVAASSLPGVANLDAALPAESYARTAFWNDFARRDGGAFHCLAMDAEAACDARGAFCAHRTRDEGPFGRREEALLAALLPHLRRVLSARARLEDAGWQAAAAGLDALRQGVALLAPDGRMVVANAALRRMAARRDGFALGRNGLRCDDARAQAALDRAVLSVLAGATGRVRVLPVAGSLAIQRPSGAMPWLVQALPVRPGDAGPEATGPLPGRFSGGMLLVTDAGARPDPSRPLLRAALGLTPAEAGLAAALARGATLASHAEKRGVSVETVRTHLAALRRKTGCGRQAEIALLVARLAGD